MKRSNFSFACFFTLVLLAVCHPVHATVLSAQDELEALGVPTLLLTIPSAGLETLALPQFQPSETLAQKLAVVDAATRLGFYPEPELLAGLADSYAYDEPFHERSELAQAIISRIPNGTTRARIEKIFPSTDGGVVGSDRGRYYFGSEVMVNVPYATLGEFSPQDKVNGPITITRSWFHSD